MDLFAIILFIWARWLSTQPGAPRWLRFRAPVLILAFFGGLGGTVLGLIYAFHSVASVDAAHKSQHLAEGISFAMNFTAAGFAIDFVVLIALIAVTVQLSHVFRTIASRPSSQSKKCFVVAAPSGTS